MQELTTFDIVIIAITIILGLKGLFKGFIKEVFGLIGIVGGIFVASRLSDQIGEVIKPVLGLENVATISVIGFVAGLIIFWLVVYFIGMILSKVSAMSGLGIFDRILGFAFGSAKIFLIFSIIAYALYQVDSFKTTLNKQFKTSIVFPVLVETGSYIIKLDTSKFTQTVDENIDSVLPTDKTIKSMTNTAKKAVQEAKQAVQETSQDIVKEATKNTTKEIVNDLENGSKTNEDIKEENIQEKGN